MRCHWCRKTQKDWDQEGRQWAKDNDAGGYGVPGFLFVDGKLICEFCALQITHAFAGAHPDFARSEVQEIWRRHNLKTATPR